MEEIGKDLGIQLTPAFKDNNIAIAFTGDSNKIPYFSVALQSILETSTKENNYDILFLSQGDILLSLKELCWSMIEDHLNFSLRFVNILSLTEWTIFPKSDWSKNYENDSYSQLFLPLIYQGAKILYLSTDILVREDIANLYKINLKDFPLGAIQDEVIYKNRFNHLRNEPLQKIYYQYIQSYLDLDIREYFNTDILLYNLDQIRIMNFDQKMIDFEGIKEKDILFPTQDWLNSLFSKSTYFINEKWNQALMSNPSISTKEGILHFIENHNKPWHSSNISNSSFISLWWEIAKKTPFYQPLKTLSENTIQYALKNEILRNQNNLKNEILRNSSLEIKLKRIIKNSLKLIIPKFLRKLFRSLLKSLRTNGISGTIKKIFSNLLKIESNKIKLTEKGITDAPRSTELIVSLTSYPPRMPFTFFTIQSILQQSIKPDKVILWLSEDEFPIKEKSLSKNLLSLQKYGLTIEWVKGNSRSFKKLVPTLAKYPEAIIVTADDDVHYEKDWLKKLYEAYLKDSSYIYTPRTAKLDRENGKWTTIHGPIEYYQDSFLNIPQGIAGILYPPKSLHPDVFREDLFMTLCPHNDDLWFWLMAIKNNYKSQLLIEGEYHPEVVLGSQVISLYSINIAGEFLMYKELNNILNYYPDLKRLVLQELARKPKVLINTEMFKKIKEDPIKNHLPGKKMEQ